MNALLDESPRRACTAKPHPLAPIAETADLEAFTAGIQSHKGYAARDTAQQQRGALLVQYEQPAKDSTPDRELRKDTFSISLAENKTLDRSADADHSAFATDLAADIGLHMPCIAGPSEDTSSLNAAADQLQAVCRQLLQGLAIPDDLQSSFEAVHDTVGRQNKRSTDVLAGLVSELEADMATA